MKKGGSFKYLDYRVTKMGDTLDGVIWNIGSLLTGKHITNYNSHRYPGVSDIQDVKDYIKNRLALGVRKNRGDSWIKAQAIRLVRNPKGKVVGLQMKVAKSKTRRYVFLYRYGDAARSDSDYIKSTSAEAAKKSASKRYPGAHIYAVAPVSQAHF